MNSARVEVLKSELRKFNVTYVHINDTTSFTKIYNLFVNGTMFEPINGIEYNYLGLYFEYVKNINDTAKKYYLMAIKKGSIIAMHNLANLYLEIGDNVNAEYYYLMAIKNNYIDTFNDLAWFYNYVKIDIVNSEIYYKIAASHNDEIAMNNLGYLYCNHENYIDAELYLLFAVKHGNIKSLSKLIYCHKITGNIIGLIKIFRKYHNFIKRTKVIENIKVIWNLSLNTNQNRQLVKFLLSFEFQTNDNIPISLKIFTTLLKNKMTIIKLHFDYAIDGQGFHDAKKDFDDRSLCHN